MTVGSLSTKRTYRYLRMSLVGLVVLLCVAIIVQWNSAGPLDSISAAYYTAIRNAFVGALVAIGVVLIAISGRRGIEDVMLNFMGMLAPVIAFVPTPLNDGSLIGQGDAVVHCPPDIQRCVPESFVPAVDADMQSLLWVGVIAIAVAIIMAARDGGLRSPVVRAGVALAVAMLAAFAGWFVFGHDSFIGGAHFAAAAAFFALMAAVAVFNAIVISTDRPTVRGFTRRTFARSYLVIAVLLVLDLAITGILLLIENSQQVDLGQQWGFPWFFIAEAIAMLFFAAFWTLQTIEKWEGGDAAELRAG